MCKERVQCAQAHATHNVYVPAHSQSPYACMPACSGRVLQHSCLIANCIITTFDYIIKTRVLVYVLHLQCINLWFTNMKRGKHGGIAHPWHVNAVSRGLSCLSWFSLLMPSLVLVDAVSQVLMFP